MLLLVIERSPNMPDIREQKLLYHLTSLSNMKSIIAEGLKPRAELKKFKDVADQGIISNRQKLGLEKLVPFHFFSRNPFDGRVQADHPNEPFALISINRSLARSRNWKIIPRHPLASSDIELMDYENGFESIDWKTMNSRDYHDVNCKSVCMAECLAPGTVKPGDFARIFVNCQPNLAVVEEQLAHHGINCQVNINEKMFIS